MTTWILSITILCSGEPGCEYSTSEHVTTEVVCREMEAYSDEELDWTRVVECVEGE